METKLAKNDPLGATSLALRDMLWRCPCCKGSLEGHAWATLSEAGDQQTIEQSLKLSIEQRWAELATIRTFNGRNNAMLIKAIKCPSGGGAVLTYVDYFELYAFPELMEPKNLSLDEWTTLNNQLPTLDWHPL